MAESILTAMHWRFVWLSALLLVTGCQRAAVPPTPSESAATSAPVGPPVKGDWLVQQEAADPDVLNPLISQDTTGMLIIGQIFEGLLQMNNNSLQLEPCLASTYEISPDQLTYTFHLRHDVTWQDGAPFTAADVKYTFDRIVDPKVDDAPVRSYFTTLKACEVVDPYTVRFVTTERYFKMLEMLGTEPIIPQHLLSNETDFNNAAFNRNPIGTGPYKFVRWDTGSQLVLQRNDHYWGVQNHYLDRIVYRVIEEPYVAVQLLKKGEVDVVDPVQASQYERELANTRSLQRLTTAVYDYPAYGFLGFNLRRPIFQDVRVRHALDLLIPRDEILKQVYRGYATETGGFEMATSPAYDPSVTPTPFDPAQAATLLNAAGWRLDPGDGLLHKDGKPFSVTVVYPGASPYAEKTLVLMQEAMRRVGVDLKLERMEWVQMIAKLNDWNFEMTTMGWSLDVDSDPSQIWSTEQAKLKNSSNFVGYASPVADKLMADARLEYDPVKRAALYRQLQRVIHDDYPVCFLFNPKQIMVRSDRLQGVALFAPRPCYDTTTWWVPGNRQVYGRATAQP